MTPNTDHLRNTLRALESAVALYRRATAECDATDQEIFRMAIVKGFELTQEVCLPIRVDVMDWARIPETFRREIERGYVVVQRAQSEPALKMAACKEKLSQAN